MIHYKIREYRLRYLHLPPPLLTCTLVNAHAMNTVHMHLRDELRVVVLVLGIDVSAPVLDAIVHMHLREELRVVVLVAGIDVSASVLHEVVHRLLSV